MSDRIHISIASATEAYALLNTAVMRHQQCLKNAQNDDDKRFWSTALADAQAAHDEFAQQLFPLSHGKAA